MINSTLDQPDPSRQIAMWNCPRSRSTVITRAFEQLEGCTIFDTPLYGAYLLATGNASPEHRHPRVEADWEQDYTKVIAAMTRELPEGRYVFQRHISRTVLPAFGRDWLASLTNFFLIRHPKDILVSYKKVLVRYGEDRPVTFEDIGIDILWGLVEDVTRIEGKRPLIVHSDDLARAPADVLRVLCGRLGVPFSESMLSWEPNLQGSTLRGDTSSGDGKSWSETWYTSIANSSGFTPFRPSEEPLDEALEPLLERCLPYYEKLNAHKLAL